MFSQTHSAHFPGKTSKAMFLSDKCFGTSSREIIATFFGLMKENQLQPNLCKDCLDPLDEFINYNKKLGTYNAIF
jgi:hypothetical protein